MVLPCRIVTPAANTSKESRDGQHQHHFVRPLNALKPSPDSSINTFVFICLRRSVTANWKLVFSSPPSQKSMYESHMYLYSQTMSTDNREALSFSSENHAQALICQLYTFCRMYWDTGWRGLRSGSDVMSRFTSKVYRDRYIIPCDVASKNEVPRGITWHDTLSTLFSTNLRMPYLVQVIPSLCECTSAAPRRWSLTP